MYVCTSRATSQESRVKRRSQKYEEVLGVESQVCLMSMSMKHEVRCITEYGKIIYHRPPYFVIHDTRTLTLMLNDDCEHDG